MSDTFGCGRCDTGVIADVYLLLAKCSLHEYSKDFKMAQFQMYPVLRWKGVDVLIDELLSVLVLRWENLFSFVSIPLHPNSSGFPHFCFIFFFNCFCVFVCFLYIKGKYRWYSSKRHEHGLECFLSSHGFLRYCAMNLRKTY